MRSAEEKRRLLSALLFGETPRDAHGCASAGGHMDVQEPAAESCANDAKGASAVPQAPERSAARSSVTGGESPDWRQVNQHRPARPEYFY